TPTQPDTKRRKPIVATLHGERATQVKQRRAHRARCGYLHANTSVYIQIGRRYTRLMHLRWVKFCAALAAVGVSVVPSLCSARVPTRLVYSRTQSASDCPDEAALAAAVATRLGYEPFSPWGDQTIVA